MKSARVCLNLSATLNYLTKVLERNLDAFLSHLNEMASKVLSLIGPLHATLNDIACNRRERLSSRELLLLLLDRMHDDALLRCDVSARRVRRSIDGWINLVFCASQSHSHTRSGWGHHCRHHPTRHNAR